MSDAARAAVITELARELKMPAVLREYEAIAREARDAGWPYEDFLRTCLDAEVHSRRDAAVRNRTRAARFPDVKSMDDLDFAALKGISRPKLLELASCRFIDDAQDVVLAGPVGTGKTHVALALGLEACRRRKHVRFVRAAELVRSLVEARDEKTLTRLLKRYQRVSLLIVDELGFVPLDRTEAELLFNLLAERHSRRSTILTTNLAFSEWVQVFQSEKLTVALLDRLGSSAHVLTTKGESYRTRRRRRPRRSSKTDPGLAGSGDNA